MPDDRPVAESLSSYLANSAGLALPELAEAEEAANQITTLYEESGRTGATFSLRFGDTNGQPLYSVSLWPDRGLKLSSEVLELDTFLLFVQINMDLLNDARCGVGLWSNGQVTFCDIVALLPTEQEATALAVSYDQIAIFDLYTLTEIETGGSGNTPLNMPIDTQRLPEINPKEEPR